MKSFVHVLTLLLCFVLLLGGCNTPPAADDPATATTPSQSTTTTVNAEVEEKRIPLPETIDRSITFDDMNTEDLPYIPGVEFKDMEAKRYNRQYYALTSIYDDCVNLNSLDMKLIQYHEDPTWLQAEVDKLVSSMDIPTWLGVNIIDFVRLANLDKEVFTAFYEEFLKSCKQRDESDGIEWTEERAEQRTRLSYEDIDVLYSGDEVRINKHFKSPFAVFTNKNEILPLSWFVEHTVDEWIAAGVTMENAEKPITAWKISLGDTFLEQSGIREKLVEFFEKAE